MDSDGDGRSNGEELGDPECVWTQGTEPQRTAELSHPGKFMDILDIWYMQGTRGSILNSAQGVYDILFTANWLQLCVCLLA